MTKTAPTKYVFFDVVSFTTGRSVEAQAEIVEAINGIVRSAVSSFQVAEDRLVLLPTGDGLCVALINVEDPVDIHVAFALRVVQLLSEHNAHTSDPTRQFALRVGINSNVDNVVTDINGRTNLAGAGINLAARVMSLADGNQILVGQPVFEILRHREKYMNAFRAYSGIVKHGLPLPVFQLVSPAPGLSVEIPTAFAKAPRPTPVLDRTLVYYLALAFTHAKLLPLEDTSASVLWLWYTAKDCVEHEHPFPDQDSSRRTFGSDRGLPVEEQIAYYESLEHAVKWDLAEFIVAKYLDPFWEYFERGKYSMLWQRPLPSVREKLLLEHAEVCKIFNLSSALPS